MDDFGICTRCEDTQFVDDLITLGDNLLCDDCYEEL
jgi:formylmethanofuran dehydrogenase subunit E